MGYSGGIDFCDIYDYRRFCLGWEKVFFFKVFVGLVILCCFGRLKEDFKGILGEFLNFILESWEVNDGCFYWC